MTRVAEFLQLLGADDREALGGIGRRVAGGPAGGPARPWRRRGPGARARVRPGEGHRADHGGHGRRAHVPRAGCAARRAGARRRAATLGRRDRGRAGHAPRHLGLGVQDVPARPPVGRARDARDVELPAARVGPPPGRVRGRGRARPGVRAAGRAVRHLRRGGGRAAACASPCRSARRTSRAGPAPRSSRPRRRLRALRQLGWITTGRRAIEVHDVEALRRRAP